MRKSLLATVASVFLVLSFVANRSDAATYTGCSSWRTVTNPWTGLAILPGSNQRFANINGLDMSCADLNGVDFYGAVIGGNNWTNSNLSNTNFGGTGYCGGIFTGADITGSNLTSTSTWSCAARVDVYVAPSTAAATTTTAAATTTTTTAPNTTAPNTTGSSSSTVVANSTTSTSIARSSTSSTTTLPKSSGATANSIGTTTTVASRVSAAECPPTTDSLYIYNYFSSAYITNYFGRYDSGSSGYSFDYTRNCKVLPITKVLIKDNFAVRETTTKSINLYFDTKISNCWQVARVSGYGQSEWSNQVCYTAPAVVASSPTQTPINIASTLKGKVPKGVKGAQCFLHTR